MTIEADAASSPTAAPHARDTDIAVIGAGAAGLMAALAARGAILAPGESRAAASPPPRVVLLDGSTRIGLKILISGGGRCNVTNDRVVEGDYDSDAPKIVRAALHELPPAAVRAFLLARGCALYAEPLGKLFPQTDRARDVLSTLMSAVSDAGATIDAGRLVQDVRLEEDGVSLRTSQGNLHARRVIVATGGKSLPKTGSQGFGLDLAKRLGHTLDPPLPALVPVLLAADGPLAGLAGVTVPTLLSLVRTGTAPEQVESRRFRPLARAAGSMLITHDGISGPAALDVSGACGLALLDRPAVTDSNASCDGATLEADFLSLAIEDGPNGAFVRLKKPPGACLPDSHAIAPLSEESFRALLSRPPRGSHQTVVSILAEWLPRSLANALLSRPPKGTPPVDPNKPLRELSKRDWQAIHRAICHADLRLRGTGGYQKAEVTRGGVPLRELHRNTLESRIAPRVHFCGEVCNATGRLGGFNFQWAWSSGYIAGRGAAAALAGSGP